VYEHICEDSPKNAFKVLEAITGIVNNAAANPTSHPPDKYKLNNDGTYRSFVKHSYRISYRVTNNTIRVLRVRHTSRKAKVY
jgi:plasmid stabilization system protein ParE